jgi:transposase
MDTNELFTMALGCGQQWRVNASRFEGQPRKLELSLEPTSGVRWACPECGAASPVHDTVEKRWRHLNFFQYECELRARVPRCRCAEHGVRTVGVPWAREGSGFTLMFEAMAMLLCAQMPVADAAELLGEQDTRLWRMLRALVERAQAGRCWRGVRRVLVDETSARRGHRYVTLFVDAESRELLLMCEGRKADTVREFAEALRAHGGEPAQIEWLGLDMSGAYIAGAAAHLPQARLAFDHFHIAALAGKALDEVRRELARENGGMKGSRWAILGNEWTRSKEQAALRRAVCAQYPKLGRALGLRESLQDILATKDEESLRWWCGWAARSRLGPFQRLARTLRKHWGGILGYFESGITSAAIEAMNGKIQLAKRLARGFRNFTFFRAIAYLKAAKLDLKLPALAPT